MYPSTANMLKPFSFLSSLFAVVLLASCSSSLTDETEQTIVAEAYGQKLTEDQLLVNIRFNTYEDSLFAAEEYISQWVRQCVLVHHAKSALPDGQLNKKDLLDNYYNDLLIYDFQNYLIAGNIDTSVADSVIQSYYQENKSSFELKENIVKLIFFKIPNSYNGFDAAFRRFKQNEEKVYNELAVFCARNGGNFLIDPNSWLSFNDVLREIPINSYNQEHFLNNNTHIRIDGSSFTYFVRILNFKFKNSLSPYEFEKDRIKNIILNKRKIQLIEQKERALIQSALNSNEVRQF